MKADVNMLEKKKHFYICPYSRCEVLITIEGNSEIEAECPTCKKKHFLPDGDIHSMEEFMDLNMWEIGW